MLHKGKYDNFIFFSAGPVGDHVLQVDFANYLFESTGKKTTIILKHPNSFLKELSLPYNDHINYIEFKGVRGIFSMLYMSFLSIMRRSCYILVFPIPAPTYLKVFSYFIRFFTRSRIVGFNLEGTKSFPIGKGYESFLGKKNTIPLLAEPYYLSVRRMLSFLDLPSVERLPSISYVDSNTTAAFTLPTNYIAMHICASHALRTLPPDRWKKIIQETMQRIPEATFVFTGSKQDQAFIDEATANIQKEKIISLAGKTGTQELLNVYKKARMCVTVQTGNGLIINLLHAPSVVVNIKGTAMFYYDFNKNATILHSEKDCICNPFETQCNMVSYKGKEYMACLFNLSDEEIVEAIVAKYIERS